jgi:hypothetical protein
MTVMIKLLIACIYAVYVRSRFTARRLDQEVVFVCLRIHRTDVSHTFTRCARSHEQGCQPMRVGDIRNPVVDAGSWFL